MYSIALYLINIEITCTVIINFLLKYQQLKQNFIEPIENFFYPYKQAEYFIQIILYISEKGCQVTR